MILILNINMKSQPHEVFRQYLESQGLKLTKQRTEILDYLLRARDHATPERIHADLRAQDPLLGRATVFRTLHLLEKAGFAGKILFPDGSHGYEHKFARPHHDHMICVECRDVIEFSNATIERLQDQISRQFQFTPLWHRHEIFGRCRKCGPKGTQGMK